MSEARGRRTLGLLLFAGGGVGFAQDGGLIGEQLLADQEDVVVVSSSHHSLRLEDGRWTRSIPAGPQAEILPGRGQPAAPSGVGSGGVRLRAPLGIVGLLAITALIAPAGAGATLVFSRNPLHPAVFAARDNGKGVRRLGGGSSPHISPDGRSAIYRRAGSSPELVLTSPSGGPLRTLMKGWQETFELAFSPNSRLIAAERGHELGKRKLVVINLTSGRQRVLASGFFNGFSFSPDSEELVYSRSGRGYSDSGEIFRVGVDGGSPVALSKDHRSISPLWGPGGEIVFDRVHQLKAPLGPKAQLYLMNARGGDIRQLTHTRVPPLIFGLTATAWSANGRRLLAEYGGEDTSYAVAVNPRSGAERKLIPSDTEMGFAGVAISGDGRFVLGLTGEEPGPHQQIAVVPYGGGKKTVIIANGDEPDWNR